MLRSELQGSGPLNRLSTRNSMDSASQLATPQRNASGTSSASNRNSIASTLLRHNSASSDRDRDHKSPAPTSQPSSLQPTEQRWIHRLKELERRLKAEREARLLDRRGARERLEEGRQENEELRNMLERERERERFGESQSGRSSPNHAEYPTIGTR
ncbi:micro-tubular organizer Mto1 C-term Mto2-binding region-domain-containing protein [Phyllosticta citrichinensis]